MTAEYPHPSAPDQHEPELRAAEFLYRVFDESKYMLQDEKGAKVISEVRSQFVRRWSNDRFPFNLVKAEILRSERHDYGLVIGVRGFDQERIDKLSFEFGKISHLGRPYEETLKRWSTFPEEQTLNHLELRYLDSIVHQPVAGTYGSGRFYVRDGIVEVDCWADRRLFGGSEVGKFPWGGEQTVAGLGDYIDIVRQVANCSWR
jgi:hypothetical protein